LANLPVYHSDEHEKEKKRSKAISKDKQKKDYDTFVPRMSGKKEGGGGEKREWVPAGAV